VYNTCIFVQNCLKIIQIVTLHEFVTLHVLKLIKLGLWKTFLLEYKSDDGSKAIGTKTTPLSLLRSCVMRTLHVTTYTNTSDGLRIRSKSLRSVSYTTEI